MVKCAFQIVLSLLRQDWTVIGRTPVEVDWEPAGEWCRFQGIRHGELSPVAPEVSVEIEPVRHEKLGEPWVGALQVTAQEEGGGRTTCTVPTGYFASVAQEASATFVKNGAMEAGELFRYLVAAFPTETASPGAVQPASRIEVRTVIPPLPLKESSLAAFMQRSVRFSQEAEDEIPAFVPRRVLDEAAVLTRQAGAMEAIGFLIGHLHRDPATPELFLEVTALLPARSVRSELMKVTLTHASWAAAEGAIKLRRRHEIMLGWFHSHSYMKETCKDCRKVKDGSCKTNPAFMSTEDCALHRTCFPRAYSIALVVGDSPCTGLSYGLFGWHVGVLCQRNFMLLHDFDSLDSKTPEHAAAATGGQTDAAR